MKSKTKLIIAILTLIINLGLLMGCIYYLSLNDIEIITPNGDDDIPQAISPISIDGDGTNNWAWAVTQPWCTGSGTWNDPYRIENLDIDGTGSEICITIRNSNVYFLIRKCVIYKAEYAGIALFNVNHGLIENNTITDNNARDLSPGLVLENSENNMIIGNKIFRNKYGLTCKYCGFNNITENSIKNNEFIGINISYSFDIVVQGNTIRDNEVAVYQSFTNFSVIYKNRLDFSDDVGLFLQNSYFSQISSNIINYNTLYGIHIYTSNQNLFFDNSFHENGVNAEDHGKNNQWDYNLLGNYWSDYTGFDADDNGIGDTPYNITGSAGSQDNYPIWDDGPG